jgi:hypothetical protein
LAEKDKIQRTLESYNDVFADIVNVLLFGGKETVHENDLTDAQPFSYYKMEGKKIHSQERDVSKFWNNGQIRLSVIGFENQMKVEKDMPLRVISYDGAAYRSQLIKKEKESYYPVITLILYFGSKEHWKNNRSLKEVLPVPTELEPFVSDYKINVFELAWLTDKQISMFKSDFRDVVQFLKCQRTGKKFTGSEKKLQHAMEILDLLRVMSNNDSNLVSTIEDLREESIEGGIGMCDVVQYWVDKGSQQKAVEDAINCLKEGDSPEKVARCIGLPLKKVQELQKAVPVKA